MSGKLKEDLTGKKFDKLTVLYRAPNDKRGQTMWTCLCECGQIRNIRGTSLKSGITKTCGGEGCRRPHNVEDITGKTFGDLTALYRDYNHKGKATYWVCKCSCGNIKSIDKKALMSGRTISCSCKGRGIKNNLIGKRFGRLEVVERVESEAKKVKYKCQCDCGNIKDIFYNNLVDGSTISCGCYRDENSKEAGKRFNSTAPAHIMRNAYKNYYGSIPSGYRVTALNGDMSDISKENLCLISKRTATRLWRAGISQKDIAEIKLAAIRIEQLNERIFDLEKNKHKQ